MDYQTIYYIAIIIVIISAYLFFHFKPEASSNSAYNNLIKSTRSLSRKIFSVLILLCGLITLIPFAGAFVVILNVIFYGISRGLKFSSADWKGVAMTGLVITIIGAVANLFFYGIDWSQFNSL